MNLVFYLALGSVPLQSSPCYNVQVRLVMLPSKRQKHKSKVRQGTNPQYTESFLLHRVNPGELNEKQRQAENAETGLK